MGLIVIGIIDIDIIQFLIVILEPQRVLDLAQYPIPGFTGGIGGFGVVRVVSSGFNGSWIFLSILVFLK